MQTPAAAIPAHSHHTRTHPAAPPAATAAQPDAQPDTMPLSPAGAALVAALRTLDLTSADGRAGIGGLLAEIERLAPRAWPAALQRQAAIHDLRRVRGAARAPVT